MQVTMYNPAKLYGFARSADTGAEVFFHLEVFRPGVSDGPEPPPPPVAGELVTVEYDPSTAEEGKPPRASKVVRAHPQVLLQGRVDQFDEGRGWGFITGADGKSYHLHRSEVLDGRLPLPGGRVSFFGGSRRDRPRACYVRVLSG